MKRSLFAFLSIAMLLLALFLDIGPYGRNNRYTLTNGDVYEDEWKGWKYHGRGKYTAVTGGVYEGEYKDGKEEGRGKQTFASGDVYDGEWKDGKREARGTHTLCEWGCVRGRVQGWEEGGMREANVSEWRCVRGRMAGWQEGEERHTRVDGRVLDGWWESTDGFDVSSAAGCGCHRRTQARYFHWREIGARALDLMVLEGALTSWTWCAKRKKQSNIWF